MYSKLPNQKPHQQYNAVNISTIDRGRLLIMLFDGCLKFLTTARNAIQKNNVRQFAKFLSKSQAIISELLVTLDHTKGGEISRDLERLYDFMLFNLTEANLNKDARKIQEVIDILSTIAQGYREIVASGTYKADLAKHEAAPIEKAKKPEDTKLGTSSLEPVRGKTLSVSF